MKDKTDRRVKYTRALLKNALIELMQTTHISKISIKALCEAADVHRTTFYAHYKDQYDLLLQIEQELFEDITRYLDVQEVPQEQQGFPLTIQKLNWILQYIQENAPVVKALLSVNSDIAFQRDLMQFMDIIPINFGMGIDEKTREYIGIFYIDACISVLNKWLEGGMAEPLTSTTSVFQRTSILGFLNRRS